MSRLANPREHDDLLNYQLKRLVSAGGAPAVRLCEGLYGITRQEWRVLAALVESGAMGSSALAERCQIERAVVSRQIGVLVGKQLVRRLARSAKRPRAEVETTTAGAELYAALFPQLAEINRRLMAVLDEAESLQLERLLTSCGSTPASYEAWTSSSRACTPIDVTAGRAGAGRTFREASDEHSTMKLSLRNASEHLTRVRSAERSRLGATVSGRECEYEVAPGT